MSRVIALIGLMFLAPCTACAGNLPSRVDIDAEARRLMSEQDVRGMALAVIENGQIRDVTAYGCRNVE